MYVVCTRRSQDSLGESVLCLSRVSSKDSNSLHSAGLMTASLQCVRFVRVITKTPTCRQDFAGVLNSLTRQGLFPLLFF